MMWYGHACGGPRWRSRAGSRGRGRGFGMWGFRARFFGPGELRLALLSLLSEGPRHGYELVKQRAARSGGMYRASAGSVYPTLQQLEDEGLVRSAAEDGKRVYRITPEGEREVEDQAATVRRIWRRAEEWGEWGDWGSASAPETWELWRPAMQLAKEAMRTVARDPDAVEEVRRILERARRQIEDLEDER